MHEEILSKEQLEILPFLKGFSSKFGLVGGTAVALQIGHRRSIDYDLFSLEDFSHTRILTMIKKRFKIESVLVNNDNELTLLVDRVKMTFYYYPFPIQFTEKLRSIVRMPDLLTLAAMKGFALGRRNKWKDYVDLYFILKIHSLSEIIARGEEIFEGAFNSKLFTEQLHYFKDISNHEQEPVEYLSGFETSEKIIQAELKRISLQMKF